MAAQTPPEHLNIQLSKNELQAVYPWGLGWSQLKLNHKPTTLADSYFIISTLIMVVKFCCHFDSTLLLLYKASLLVKHFRFIHLSLRLIIVKIAKVATSAKIAVSGRAGTGSGPLTRVSVSGEVRLICGSAFGAPFGFGDAGVAGLVAGP